MALSMDEQRMLEEIERRLADEDPVLAARLTAFGPPGLGITLRSRRGRMLASLIALITLAVISAAAYAIVPLGLRHSARPRPTPASSRSAVTAPKGGSSHATAAELPPPRTEGSATEGSATEGSATEGSATEGSATEGSESERQPFGCPRPAPAVARIPACSATLKLRDAPQAARDVPALCDRALRPCPATVPCDRALRPCPATVLCDRRGRGAG